MANKQSLAKQNQKLKQENERLKKLCNLILDCTVFDRGQYKKIREHFPTYYGCTWDEVIEKGKGNV